MCGICNIFRCGSGRRCGCRKMEENECDRRANWREPCMKVHCASGLGTESERPCGMDHDRDCGCSHHHDCGCDEDRHHSRRRDCDCD